MCPWWGKRLDISLAPLAALRKEFMWLTRNPSERFKARNARVDKDNAHSYLCFAMARPLARRHAFAY